MFVSHRQIPYGCLKVQCACMHCSEARAAMRIIISVDIEDVSCVATTDANTDVNILIL